MLDVLIVSEQNFGKNLIAGTFLKDLGGEYFTVECAGFELGSLSPPVQSRFNRGQTRMALV